MAFDDLERAKNAAIKLERLSRYNNYSKIYKIEGIEICPYWAGYFEHFEGLNLSKFINGKYCSDII